MDSPEDISFDRAFAAATSIQQTASISTGKAERVRRLSSTRVARPTPARLATSLDETPGNLEEYLQDRKLKQETVLYLAYGSNLSKETFRGSRGIQPLSQINVQVPSLRLTFDLPGIPYAEPCFANTARRDPNNDPPTGQEAIQYEKTPLLWQGTQQKGYRKDRWHKGLIGVVYEVTPEDYAHIIATEGGGSSYKDILVECHPLATSDPNEPVPSHPTQAPFKARTLFAPAARPGEDPPKDGGRFQRPDTSYAQASARYLKLLKDGAAELELPYEYQDYLQSLHPYTITEIKQRVGQFVFLAMWAPLIAFVFGISRLFVDKNGRQPKWMRDFSGAVFKAVWASYDNFFRGMFGDGERTITDGGGNESNKNALRKTAKEVVDVRESGPVNSGLEKPGREKPGDVLQIV